MHSSSSSLRLALAALVVSATLSLNATPIPQNLGNGLDKIVENNLLQQEKIQPPAPSKDPAAATPTDYITNYKAAVARDSAAASKLALTDSLTGKYLVDIMPDGRVPLAILQSSLQAQFPAFDVRHIDTKYAGHGVLEGYITVDDAPNIAKYKGVGSVILQLRPMHSVGAVTSQGVNQHRINRINTSYNAGAASNWDGTGMSVGVMSDSYNSQPSEEGGFTTAEADVASGDLPGLAAGANPQPVVVLEDFSSPPNATNEGRGMCQIVADIAPKARIGFATADTGEVGFANNIRALAGLPGFTYPAAVQQGFKGDVVCDDVSYLDEPMFQDGIVAQGVIDVVNAGTTYCSSAANNWGTDGYASTFRPVANGTGATAAAGNTALTNTNINLAGVDPSLYAGGFHNFNPSGLDVAQTFNTANDPQAAVFQWNDPYDTTLPTLGPIVFGPVTGNSTGGAAVDFQVTLTAGQEYVVTEKATPQNPTENLDAIVAIIDPNGKTVVDQDTGVDETVIFFAPASGQYTIRVHPFATASPVGGPPVPTQGTFSLQVNTANGVARITQDFNLLFFDMNGAFIQAIASNNIANNRPYEIFVPAFSGSFSQVQLVISRANTTTPPNAADQLKYVFFGNGASGMGPAEYNSYLTPVTFGHSAAAGANSVAAYAMFRPNLPEDFTSPGPVAIYFDTNNNRLATPQIRQKPDIAAADGANNTFFPLGPGGDYPFDPDTFPNFYGTSAASPHSAAIAALVLQAHKPAILTPAQVKTIMQLSAFPHDLDPYAVSGVATAANGGAVSISVVSDNSANTSTGANDPNAWSVTYTGPGFLKSITFNPEGTAQTGGNPTGGNFTGVTPADFMNPALYKFTPGMVFTSTFLFGSSTGLTPSDVTHTRSNPAPPPSNPSPGNPTAHEWTLNLGFPNNNFTNGKVVRFDPGRNQQQDANSPQGMTTPVPLFGQPNTNSADILGSGVLLPEYGDSPNILPGMTFSGVVSDGVTDYPFSGRLTNRVGKGYSPLDGYGFINAEAAVATPLPTPGVVSRKVHGGAGAFDIPLPVNGPAGIECRYGGPNGDYTMIYSFDRIITAVDNASVSQGSATVSGTTLGPAVNQFTVNLTGATNPQHLVVTLNGIHDTSSAVTNGVLGRMDVLVGDTNADSSVNSGDISQTKSQSGQTASASNFREDLNTDGTVNSGDISLVKSRSGTGLSSAGSVTPNQPPSRKPPKSRVSEN